ncbi:MAG: cadmium-translocating P-type ATPase [Clostridia bacterium]|nr:cadmium-translocating P-type ATPase [Clostridia bacterium]
MRKELFLQGLGCAHCAQKIEESVAKLEEVLAVRVNFTTSTMALEMDPEVDFHRVLREIKKIVNNIESEVVVQEKLPENEEFSELAVEKKKLLKLGVGGFLFLLALLFEFSFPVELGFYLLSYILVGGEIIKKACINIARGQVFDENFLMFIATVGAFLIREFPEAVAVMLFYQIGETFQDLAVNRSRKSIKALLDIRPEYANLLRNGIEKKVDPQMVALGDVIIIKPGERVPLDGEVVEGTTFLDTVALTGESVPRKVEVGEKVLSGSINKTGVIKVKVTKEYGDSTVTKIIELVQNASNRKAPTENFISKFAAYYTPVVVFGALGLAFIPLLVIDGAQISDWVYRALVFLVVSCPCALVISIPLGFFGGIGGASRNGILVKGGNYLEALNYVSTVVFDKTGTLTKGVFRVSRIMPQAGFNREEVLKWAATAEVHSQHPIAKSILEAYEGNIEVEKIETYTEIAGRGVKARYEGRNLTVGNDKLMAEENIACEKVTTLGTVVHVAVDGVYLGCLIISDEVKDDAEKTIDRLRKLGIKKQVMLTGDNREMAEQVAEKLKLDRVYAELLPDKKVEIVEELLKEQGPKEKLIFVGDGINDAPVLARADIGVAMGGLGSDAAIEASDVVLMTDEPGKLVDALLIARKTKTIVWQNIVFALGVKVFVLLLGALGLATLWQAVFADVGVALIAVLNAMRAMNVKVRVS